jgi:hypothetical protein
VMLQPCQGSLPFETVTFAVAVNCVWSGLICHVSPAVTSKKTPSL